MDEDRQRRGRILNIILLGSIAMLVILDAIVLSYSLREGGADHEISFAAFSILPAFFIFLYALSRRGFPTLASYLLVTGYLVSDSYAAYRWGVTMQVVLLAYALIIVTATILHGTKFGFFVTAVISAFIIPLWYAQYHGIVATQAQKMRTVDAVIFSIFYVLIMIVAWLYNREIERSLERARASEDALKQERDSLEVKVKERTAELRESQLEKVRQLNRLAELGRLSSGLFHDLLNLLNAISLRSEDHADPSLASVLNTTKQIEGFMQAVRKQIGNADAKELFSLTEGIGHAIQLVNYKANKERVRIIFSRDPHVDMLHFDAPYKFQEIVINLLFNAIESYEQLPPDDTRVRRVEITIEERAGIALLRVEDNGCGMPPEVQKMLFEPFFTTKSLSKGIGIGLTTIKKIIEEDLGGTIAMESMPSAGSVFVVNFPIQHERPLQFDLLRTRPREKPPVP
jgi:signal transduction histidine kinase